MLLTRSRTTRTTSAGGALATLVLATAIGSLGLAAGGTAGALLATEMTGSTSAAGLPLGVLVAGSAAGALLISHLSGRAGRSAGLVLGYAIGAAGAALAIAAAALGDFALLLAGSAALGAANSAVFLTRYAAADLGGPRARGRALGTVLFAASAGAIASPNLLGPGGDLAAALGLPPLAGLYLIAMPSFAAAGLLLARSGPAGRPAAGSREAGGRYPRPARTALLVLGMVNLVMVALMAIAPIHLTEHGHGLHVVGLIISLHVAAMFVPAPLSGWAADRLGGRAVAASGAVLLIAAGLASAAAPASGVALTIALILLGLGWNAGVVGGSTLLAASVPPALRSRAEGLGETAMGLAAAGGAPAAGLIAATGGYPTLSLAGAAAALLLLTAVAVRQPGASQGSVGEY